jgi:hypothetical protein
MFTLALIIYVSGEVWEFPMPSMKTCWSLRQRSIFVANEVEPPRYIYCIPVAGRRETPDSGPNPDKLGDLIIRGPYRGPDDGSRLRKNP